MENEFVVADNSKTVTYNYILLDDSSTITASTTEQVPANATITLDSTKILAETASYVFAKFTISGTDYNLNDTYTMPDADLTIDQYYAAKYSITYDLDGESVENGLTNPDVYTQVSRRYNT